MYKVRYFQDDIYEVYDDENYYDALYQGSLANCEAWIRLKEGNRF